MFIVIVSKANMFSRLYLRIINTADRVLPPKIVANPLYNHPAGRLRILFEELLIFFDFVGPKTIFFWAPIVKWVSYRMENSIIFMLMTTFCEIKDNEVMFGSNLSF